MAFKVNFRFARENYSTEIMQQNNSTIKTMLLGKLDEKQILYTRIYAPSRNSIKVLFPSDDEVNKVLANTEHFNPFQPKISMALKSSRTIFCIGFNEAILRMYNSVDIREELEGRGWEIAGIYTMKNSKAMKIEFKTSKIAKKFLENTNTSVGGVKLLQEHKEREVNPTINQCWECGVINPDHSSNNCQGKQVCLKCGITGHKFYDCSIPRKNEDMTTQDREERYCVPCGKRGDHTSLDHSYCPKKRDIIQERVRAARETRKTEIETNQKDIELIKSVFEYSNTNVWPTMNTKQHTSINTIISMALLDEAINPGIFQNKLKKGCEENGIPAVKYTIERNTATEFFNTMCGAKSQNRELTQAGIRTQAGTSRETDKQGETQVQDGTHAQTLFMQHKQRQHILKRTQSPLPQFKILQSQLGSKEAKQIYSEIENINNYIEGNGTLGKDISKKGTPHKIKINTNYTLNNTGRNRENVQGAAAQTPETLRNHQKSPDTTGIPETWEDLDIDNTSQSLNDSYLEQEIVAEEYLDIEADNNYLLLSDSSNTEDIVTQTPTHKWECQLCRKLYTPGDSFNKHIKECIAKYPIVIPQDREHYNIINLG